MGNSTKVSTAIDLARNTDDLDLSYCELKKMPPQAFLLKQVKVINVAGNKIKDLTQARLDKFKHLITLDAAGTVPTCILCWQSSQQLSYVGNCIQEFPASLLSVKSLVTLNLAFNQINTLPTGIGTLKQLVSLDLSGNVLTSIPSEISQLSSLLVLKLEKNRLTSLPASLSQMTALQKLTLHENQFQSIPAVLAQLKLFEINLQKNLISTLEPQIVLDLAKCKEVQVIDLSYNRLKAVPTEITELFQLRELNLMGNKIVTWPYNTKSLLFIKYQFEDENKEQLWSN
ncbi:hypothetical protein MP228_005343 [Amoeboaphelidium protococcarum]|nr:hypothetical protein MP228_005343 [Amoeboaphelidium protococcarum]